MKKKYQNLSDFYPFYLSQHQHPLNRFLHVLGSSIGIVLLVQSVVSKELHWVLLGLLIGYTCAWIGHFLIEKNRPATFTYPFYSFVCDFLMLFEILTLRRGLNGQNDSAPS